MINPFTRSGCPFRAETLELGKNETVTGNWFDAIPTLEFANFTAGVDYWQGDIDGNVLHLAYSDGAGGGNVDVKKFRKYIASFNFQKIAGDDATSNVQLTNNAGDTGIGSKSIPDYMKYNMPIIATANADAGYLQFNLADNESTNTTRADCIRLSLNIHNINRRCH